MNIKVREARTIPDDTLHTVLANLKCLGKPGKAVQNYPVKRRGEIFDEMEKRGWLEPNSMNLTDKGNEEAKKWVHLCQESKSSMTIKVHEYYDMESDIVDILKDRGFTINEDDCIDADAIVAYKEFATDVEYPGNLTLYVKYDKGANNLFVIELLAGSYHLSMKWGKPKKELRTHIQQYWDRIVTPEKITKGLDAAEQSVQTYLSALRTIQRAL